MLVKIIEKIRNAFKLECPACGGRMELEFYDLLIKKNVYQCEECKKEWV